METLRTLRRSRSLTFLDLSALTGISARSLAEAEYGLRRLSHAERDSLAFVLGLRSTEFTGAHQRPATAIARQPAWAASLTPQTLIAAALVAAVAAGTLQGAQRQGQPALGSLAGFAAPNSAPPALVGRAAPVALGASGALSALRTDPTADDAAAIWATALAALAAQGLHSPAEPVAPAMLAGPPPRDVAAPEPTAPPAYQPPPGPAFVLTEYGPLGCPVQPAAGRVVMTQGYGVGSHAPAETWGAVDLGVDGDGDGYAEPGASWYAPVVATHHGYVRVTLESHPAGNHVWVAEPGGVWRSGYAHLAIVTVVSGQFVRAGEVIGMIGSSGMASGPHLDYQVWRGELNIDPTGLVGCG